MTKPVITAANASIPWGQSVLAGSLFGVTDAEGDVVSQYELWDSGTAGASGYFSLAGVRQAAQASIPVSAAELANARFVGGMVAGAETVWVRAFAGGEWSEWLSWQMSTTGNAPVVSASNRGIHANQSVAASSLFAATDAEGNGTIAQYQFWDEGTDSSSGYFALSGVRQGAGGPITVSAGALAQTTYVGGAVNGAETVWVRANDGSGWGTWVAWAMSTGNALPVATAVNGSANRNQGVAAASLFSTSDADGDAITQYRFWDEGTAGSSGYFSLSGVRQAEGTGFNIAAADLANLQWIGGSVAGAELVWVRAHDGVDFGAWVSWTMTTIAPVNQLPVATPTAANHSVHSGQFVASGALFNATDADGNTITQYQFWDEGTSNRGGNFWLRGDTQPAGQAITVAAADLTVFNWYSGFEVGTETVWVRASDGTGFGPWVSWTMTATNAAPVSVPTALNQSVGMNQARSVSSLFSATDADGDQVFNYQFWDSGEGGGYFEYLGEDNVLYRQSANTAIPVNALTIMFLRYRGDAVAGSETVWVRAGDNFEYGPWVSWTMTTIAPVNRLPVAAASNGSVDRNQVVAAASLFNVSDADGNAITQYRFWDEGTAGTSGYFRLSGVRQVEGTGFTIAAADLANLQWIGGSAGGSELVWVRAHDGADFGAWTSWTMTTVNGAPSASGLDAGVAWGQPVAASTLFSTSDPESDVITAYEFWDGGDAATSGYFTVNGVLQAPKASIPVNAANLANVAFVGGTLAGPETVWVRASDGTDWSAWVSWQMTTTGNAPVASAANASIGTAQSVAASTLFSITDADGNAITRYEFWDEGAATTSGHFAIDGVAQLINPIPVNAADLSRVTYVGGENPGIENVWVRANDGSGWGAWKNWVMTTAIRFQEVLGNSGTDTYQFGALGTDKIYLSLAGNDSFQTQTGDEVMLMGGTGSDTYITGSIANTFIIVYENGNSAGDFIQPGFIVPAANDLNPTAILATVDSRHLLLGDVTANRLVLVIDWQTPANRLETWFIGGPPERVGSGHFSYTQFAAEVAAINPVNITIDQLVAEAPDALAGFSSAAFNEMLAFYATRENAIANNIAPVVTALPATLRVGQSVSLSALFSVADGNGNAIARYEFVDTTPGDTTGRLLLNGTPIAGGEIDIAANQLAEISFAAGTVAITDSLQISAYDGIAWSAPVFVGVTTQPNRAPELVAFGAITAPLGRAVPVSSWFGARDADNDAITQYEFSDGASAAGQFVLAGAVQAGTFTVSAAQLDALMYVTSGVTPFSESVTMRASDGQAWSGAMMRSVNVTATGNRQAELRIASPVQLVAPGQPAAVSAWFTAIDPDGDPIAEYKFFDHSGGPADSGFFQVNGVAQNPQAIVTAANLASVTYAPDPDVPAAQPWSGDSVSLWVTDTAGDFSAPLAQVSPYTTSNRRPVVIAADAAVGLNQSVDLPNLIGLGFTDPDGDSLFGFSFRDSRGDAGSGYLTLNGVAQGNGGTASIVGANLAQYQLRYVGGSQPGIETLWIQATTNATLGTLPSSDWFSVSIRSGDAQPDGAGNSLGSARVVSVGAGTTQAFDDVVADNDLVDYYRLDVAAPGSLALALTRLGGNADLQLLDNAGNVLANSLNPDNWSERIAHVASAGTYYARVTPVAGQDTNYHFAVSLH